MEKEFWFLFPHGYHHVLDGFRSGRSMRGSETVWLLGPISYGKLCKFTQHFWKSLSKHHLEVNSQEIHTRAYGSVHGGRIFERTKKTMGPYSRKSSNTTIAEKLCKFTQQFRKTGPMTPSGWPDHQDFCSPARYILYWDALKFWSRFIVWCSIQGQKTRHSWF